MIVRTICCIGTNDNGVLTSFVIASKCPEIRVIVLDKPGVIANWNSDTIPQTHPGVEDIIRKCRNRNLFFNSDYSTAIRSAELIFISIKGTIKTDQPNGVSLDLKEVEDITRKITNYADSNKVVIEKSTTPSLILQKILSVVESDCEPGIKIDVLSNPEFFNDGSPLDSLLNPEMVIIGCLKTPSGKAAARVLCSVYERWIPQQNIVVMSMSAASEIKLIGAAMLAQKMSSIMALTRIGKEHEVDVQNLKRFVGLEGERKIYGDMNNLVHVSECLKVPQIAEYWQSVNDRQKVRESAFLNRIKPLKGKSVAIFGISGDSDKYEDSAAIEVCKWLLSEKAKVNVCDPQLQRKQLLKILNLEDTEEQETLLNVHGDLYKAVDGTSVIISYSNFDEFSDFSFQKMYNLMEEPKTFISGLKLPTEEQLRRIGFQFENFSVDDNMLVQ
ncbi:hypothetical protein RUM43_006547 [Polyplax serrata]|uniref:UDP-glucose/GDP-mannose dehydrogenase C-terminal domain-containing protein n=1 Tax=Polyplax serrata TaxID=468196 RepID=A0AAN8PCV0_POLSC